MSTRVRDLVLWPVDPNGWSGSAGPYDVVVPNLATARVTGARVTRRGLQLTIHDGNKPFTRAIPISDEQAKAHIVDALNRAAGQSLQAAGDQVVER